MELDAKQIKARIDLVEYLGSLGIELKPVGTGGEYRGLCPFHADEAPSLQVNRRKGLWHCFGCGAGGDAISFVMQREGVDFRRALAILAGPVGIDEPGCTGTADREIVFCAATDYWTRCLAGSELARSYLQRRRVWSQDLAERYGIGFAPGGTRTRDWLLTKVFAVVDRVAKVASTKDRFTVEDLGDVRVARREAPVSSCQLYLCIAWFRRSLPAFGG
jgi:DNA primase